MAPGTPSRAGFERRNADRAIMGTPRPHRRYSGLVLGQSDVKDRQYALWGGLNPQKCVLGAPPGGGAGWVQSWVVRAPMPRQTDGAWPQGTPMITQGPVGGGGSRGCRLVRHMGRYRPQSGHLQPHGRRQRPSLGTHERHLATNGTQSKGPGVLCPTTAIA